MSKKTFNYKALGNDICRHLPSIIPDSIRGKNRRFVIDIVRNYSDVTGMALINEAELNFTDEQCEFATQVVAEWTCHKAIDLIEGCIPEEKRVFILSEVANNVLESLIAGIKQNLDNKTLLSITDKIVKEVYNNALWKLCSEGVINQETYDRAILCSSVDRMFDITHNNSNNDKNFSPDTIILLFKRILPRAGFVTVFVIVVGLIYLMINGYI